ncbi:MAG: hypothetical protein R3D55_23305 [Chloroflexota bacterium]
MACLYIADTNNHVIRIANLAEGTVHLVLADPQGLLTRVAGDDVYRGKTITLEPQTVAAGRGTLRLQIELPDGYKFNDIAPFLAEFSASGATAAIAGDAATVQRVAPSPLDIRWRWARASCKPIWSFATAKRRRKPVPAGAGAPAAAHGGRRRSHCRNELHTRPRHLNGDKIMQV